MILLFFICCVVSFFFIFSLRIVVVITTKSSKTHFDKCFFLFFVSIDKTICVVINEDFVFFICLDFESSFA
jgi:hypothetical protein